MDFSDYLSKNTLLSLASIDHYTSGIKAIEKLALAEKLINKPFNELSLLDIEIAFELLIRNHKFITKDSVGKRMYSNALKHFISFKKLGNNLLDDKKIEDIINNDMTLSITERESVLKSRIGQGVFRESLLTKYNGICPISGVTDTRILFASHIKPWSVSTNQERLDCENGFLLSVLYDKLFDLGLITFTKKGEMLISKTLKTENIEKLQITSERFFDLKMTCGLKANLEYHRDVVFVR